MKLPVMRCDTGCGECCGLAPSTEQEYQRVVKYARDNLVFPMEQGVTCPFYQGGKCKVHPVRPLICRVFGHTEKMKCSRGYNVDLPNRQIQRMVERNACLTTTTWIHLGSVWP